MIFKIILPFNFHFQHENLIFVRFLLQTTSCSKKNYGVNQTYFSKSDTIQNIPKNHSKKVSS
jgi:hypothetical protein